MKYFYEILNLNTAIIKKVINVHNPNELWTIYPHNVNVQLRIYKLSLNTDLVPLSEILPCKKYVHMYVNYQVYVCYMCTYMYTHGLGLTSLSDLYLGQKQI